MPELVWFITGCSSGLGQQLTRAILARGDKVIATARKLQSIKHLESEGAAVLQLDVTDDSAAVDSVVREAIGIYGKIDVLVNNAGYVAIGLVETTPESTYLTQLQTNFFGPLKLTQSLLPHFRSRSSGLILFMSSLSGLVAHPGVSPYAASKFALEALAESLRGEVSSSGIDVLLVEPGRFRTELLGQRNLSAPLPAQDQSASAAVEAAVRAESGRQPGDPAKLAQIVVDVVKEEGVAEGRRMPERLLLGRDCVGEFEGKVGSLVGEIEGWREVAFSTDIEQ